MTVAGRVGLGAALIAVAACGNRGGAAQLGDLRISHAAVSAPPASTEASAFVVVDNSSATTVALAEVTSPDADSVILHEMADGRMRPARRLAVPGHGRLLLVPGGYHLMLDGLRRHLTVGDTVTLQLRFEPGGRVTVRTPVLTYTDAISGLPAR